MQASIQKQASKKSTPKQFGYILRHSSCLHQNRNAPADITITIKCDEQRSGLSLYALVQAALRSSKFSLIREDSFLESFPVEKEELLD